MVARDIEIQISVQIIGVETRFSTVSGKHSWERLKEDFKVQKCLHDFETI